MTTDATPFERVLGTALAHALSHLDSLRDGPVGPGAAVGELRQRLWHELEREGIEATRVIEELVRDTRGGIQGSGGGRFFAWVIGGALPAALAADWLVSAWDQNAAAYACGPAEVVIEEIAGAWLKDVLGLPVGASFAFVTGTQAAHTTCLAAARHRLLARLNWDVEEQGLFGAPNIRIFSSSERHGSIERALRLLGFGKNAVIDVPCDPEGRLTPGALAAAMAAFPPGHSIVLLQAGDLNIGAFDPFTELIPIARQHGAWIHVDGAFGLWAQASPRHRHLVDGIALADSWTTDGHKWLNTPFDCGYAFVADPEAHRASMAHRASYMLRIADAREPVEWNPEWSRRGRAVPTYAALRQLGRNGLAALIDRTCTHARSLVDAIGNLPGAEIVWRPVLNQGLLRFHDPRPGATDADHDRETDAVIADIVATGEAYFGGTSWRGQRCMRVSVCNWQTDDADVERTVEAARGVLLKRTIHSSLR